MTPAAVTADTLADLTAQLVDIPSVTGDERAIADWVAARLARRGTGEVLRSGLSVVWRGPERGRPLVLLVGHLDTVPPQGNAGARREGGMLYGIGTTDMKSGDAVMLALVESLDPAALRFDLACVFYDAEEGPAERNGLKRVLAEMPWLTTASLAVVLEPTDLRVEMGCNGVLNVEVRVPGVAGHAARPWTGRNAVHAGAEWLAAIAAIGWQERQVQGIAYRETLEVTTLTAGVARNVLPAEMVVNLNHRFNPDRTVEQAVAAVRARVPAEFGFRVVDAAPPGAVGLDHPEIAAFVRRFGLTVAGKQGWTDVARLTSAGVPAFNYGPGLAELCHRTDEHLPVAHLEVVYRNLAAFLTEAG
jgi:succinyl-diaminopimelate desuccinylase